MIQLDLRNLTRAHFDEAAPHTRGCLYSNPCIIGTLMTPEQRKVCDEYNSPGSEFDPSSESITCLVSAGIVSFPDRKQADAAEQMQRYFDDGNIDAVQKLVEHWSTQS